MPFSSHELVCRLRDKAIAFSQENWLPLSNCKRSPKTSTTALNSSILEPPTSLASMLTPRSSNSCLFNKGHLDNVSSVVQTQIAHQEALALSTQPTPPEDPRIPSIIETLDELRRVWSQRPAAGAGGPGGPSGPTGPSGPLALPAFWIALRS